jgi:gliding motility-associated lipoprotein GldH
MNLRSINRSLILVSISIALVIFSCRKIEVFERNVSFDNHQWPSGYKPEYTFEISDTVSLYNVFVVFRHQDAYRYNNVWLNVQIRFPGDTVRSQRLDLRLATDDKGWLGSGMDDIFEHRILITRSPQRLPKSGIYSFTLEQIMREDPLEHVLNAGIRVEKAK